jgi:hypothetical protein
VTGELVASRRVLVTVSGALAPGSAFGLTLNTSAWTTVHASLFNHLGDQTVHVQMTDHGSDYVNMPCAAMVRRAARRAA